MQNKSNKKTANSGKKKKNVNAVSRSSSGQRSQIPAANVRQNRTTAASVQSYVRSGDARVLVKHREYVADVGFGAGAGFNTTVKPINPGVDETFMWLSRIANNYEFYEFKSLSFEYVPTCSTLESGSIMIAVDYDAADNVPTTKQEFMTYLGAVQGPVWKEMTFRCDKPDLVKFGRQKFTRPTAISAGKDIKTYDIGNLLVATSDLTTTKGSLYVSYEVELSTPHVNPLKPSSFSGFVRTDLATKTYPFGGASATNIGEPVVSLVTGFADKILLPEPGEYLIDCSFGGTGLSAVNPTTFFSVDSGTASVAATSNGALNGTSTWLQGNQMRVNTSTGVGLKMTTPAAWTTLTNLTLKVLPWSFTYAY